MSEDNATSPFGACNTLLVSYQQIGHELLQFENAGTVASFREGVVTVPVEVLESYLEDLLDLGVKEEILAIRHTSPWFYSLKVLSFGIIGAVVGGLYCVSIGASVLSSFSLILILASPFASILYLAPRIGLMRRMRFARVVSAEVSRRRGRDGTTRTPLFSLESVLPNSGSKVTGAAKKLFH